MLVEQRNHHILSEANYSLNDVLHLLENLALLTCPLPAYQLN